MKILSLTMALCTYFNALAQEPVQSSIYNLSLGFGPNYGMIGTKSIIGKNHSGLLIGLGVLSNKLTYQVGAQLGLGVFYVNAGYGIYEQVGFVDHNDFAEGYVVNAGLNKEIVEGEPFFLNFGLGYSFGAQVFNGSYNTPVNSINVAAGIGYRFGERYEELPPEGFITL